MPKNAQQLIEEFTKTDQDQQVEQVRNIRRASFAIDKLAAQIAVVEDDERFPVERKQDSVKPHTSEGACFLLPPPSWRFPFRGIGLPLHHTALTQPPAA
ncbi:MAG: hypothetical protein IIU47_06680 [Lachnospiraceae bacterium]|nr:hypothetical protein [Lachnospiraceae bacterium]